MEPDGWVKKCLRLLGKDLRRRHVLVCVALRRRRVDELIRWSR
jgi:hypothetical protein